MSEPTTESTLPQDVADALAAQGIAARDETSLREALEAQVAGFTLVRMLPAAARRWKARYRILVGDAYYDAQSAHAAYARAILGALAGPATPPPPAAADSVASPPPDAPAPREPRHPARHPQ